MTSTAPLFDNLFNLIQVDESIMRADPPHAAGVPGRVFGGQIVSQAINTFASLHPQLVPHTMNYAFIAPVKLTVPLHYKVDRMEGCSIASVSAYQDDKLVGKGHIQFTAVPESLESSSIACPDYGPPSDYPGMLEVARPRGIATKSPLFPRSNNDCTSYWLKLKATSNAGRTKPIEGLSVLLFISDFSILQVAGDIYEKSKLKFSSISSLHHSVWIHDANLDPLAWYLTVTECTTISHGRPRVESHIFNENRKCENYQDAQVLCKKAGADLASIHNSQENGFVRRLAVSRGAINGVFLGASADKNGQFGWADGSKMDFENYYPGFPKKNFGECLAMDTSLPAGQWMNVDCAAPLPVACVRDQRPGQAPVCSGDDYDEGQIIVSPGFPNSAATPCDYFLAVPSGKKVELTIIMLEANTCCDSLVLYDGTLGATVIAKLSGSIQNQVYTSKTSNIMRVSWQPNGGVNVKGMVITYRAI